MGRTPRRKAHAPAAAIPSCVQPYLARPMLTARRRSPRAQAFHSSLDTLLAELNTFEERFKVFPRLPLLRPLTLSH